MNESFVSKIRKINDGDYVRISNPGCPTDNKVGIARHANPYKMTALLLYYIISISILIKCHEINNMLKSQNQYIIDINEDMDNVDSELEIINSNLNEFDTRLNNIESELPMQTNNNMEE